jgi:TolB-like protein/tetratricopeptide (TPR) repeat protein
VASSESSRTKIRFGQFEFDPSAAELHKSGVKLKLQGQPVEILGLLLERPGTVVTRGELQRKLWPDNTFVGFEDSLNAAVKRLRAALGDSPEKPRFVETLARRGYRFIGAVEFAERTQAKPAIRSLAVLPLANLSGDPKQDYFADGMTEELVTQLGRISALRVVSRTSSMTYKATGKQLPEIARELRVDGIVEGAVLRSGNRVRITAQLIEASTDHHLWAQDYEGDMRDVLSLQSRVAVSIARKIRARLTPDEQVRFASPHSTDPGAYDDYLRGRFFWNARTENSLAKAQNYFQQAIAKDPLFAPAYSGLADSFAYRGWRWGHLAPREAMPLARAAALKAIQLDEDSAEAHTSLGQVELRYEWHFKGAEQEFLRAIALNPNYATAHHYYSVALFAMGRNKESVEQARKAVEADPLSIPANITLGQSLSGAGRDDEAIAQFRRTLEMDPNNPMLHDNLSDCHQAKGLPDEAFEEEAESLIASGATNPSGVEALRRIYKSSGWPGVYRVFLQHLTASWDKDHWHFDAFVIAGLHAALGEKNAALDWLDKCLELRSGLMITLYNNHTWRWRELRADPRFAEIKRKMTLPP